MSEARIDRLLAAALHQAIADLLPLRLEFYETYLRPRGWREDAVNLGPVKAVLSFLRHEEPGAYDEVMIAAAGYAADWWLRGQPWHVRRRLRWLPRGMRLRQIARHTRQHFERSYAGTKVRTRTRRRRLDVEIRGSIFCSPREHGDEPSCRYYLAFIEILLERAGLAGDGTLESCTALGGAHCLVRIDDVRKTA